MATTSKLTAYEVANSVNVSGNTSKLYVKLTATTTGESHNNNTITSKVNINGVEYKPTHKLPKSTTTTVYENTLTITHNTDGSKTVPISYSIPTGISAGTLTGSTDVVLTKIPRYANITSFSVKARDETSVQIGYSVDSSCDWAKYSKDNGSTWADLPNTGIVTGLNPNTTYQFKLQVRRADSQLWSTSGMSTATTYDYPKPTSINDFVIGEGAMVTIYNPLGRKYTLNIIDHDTGYNLGTYTGTYAGTVNAEFKTAEAIDKQYSSIPNSTTGNYYAQVSYGNSVKTLGTKTYRIKGDETPTFNDFTFKDTNTDISDKLGSDQYLINKLSNLQVTISSTNKMVAKNHATPKEYVATIDTLSNKANYSTNGIELGMGAVINPATHRLRVRAYDSRGLYKDVYKDVIVFKYEKPVINVKLTRFNNFESETTLQVSGTFTKISVDGENKNIFKKVTYRYREKGGTWVDWALMTFNVDDTKFTCSDVILSLDNTKEFEFEVRALDTFDNNVVTGNVNIGEAIFFISSNKKQCYINGEKILTECTYKSGLDLNEIKDTCFYYVGGAENKPLANNGYLFTQYLNDNYIYQTFTVQDTGNLYKRVCSNGSWSKWTLVDSSLILYENSSGSKGTITLNETSANFSYIEIFYDKPTNIMWSSVKVPNPNGKNVALVSANQLTSTSVQIQVSKAIISGTSITRTGGGVNTSTSGNEIFTNTEIAIYKVVGYR